MTICIAASTIDEHIVTLSDTMLGGAMSSSDVSTVKFQPFARDWVAMFSADDVSQCLPVIELARKYFTGRANTLATARACFTRAYQKRLGEVAAAKVLGRFGMDMESFIKSGKRRFTESVFRDLYDEIKRTELGCEFIIFGFDGNSEPHLFTVEEPGKDLVHDKPGFCCIGSGKYAADGMLLYLGQNTFKNDYETIANVYAAKFMAEKVAGVGINSHLYVKRAGSIGSGIAPWVEAALRKEWERTGKPMVDRNLVNKMEVDNPLIFVP